MERKYSLKPIIIPDYFDYIGVYLTNRCFLACEYCITNHNDVSFINNKKYGQELNTKEWIAGLNRLQPPKEVPITLQGGEPFLHPGIWSILENCIHPIDILTALPPNVTLKKIRALKTLKWNQRSAPYPTIRVSYHRGENDFQELIPRIAELKEFVSIGLFHINHPGHQEETEKIRALSEKYKIDFRLKEYLGPYQGKIYGTYLYPEAVVGKIMRDEVLCKNTVVPIGPTGLIYRCHSDLYHQRSELALTHLLAEDPLVEGEFRPCHFYGLCSECDVKIKTNHQQVHGYTSVEIKFSQDLQKTVNET